MAWRRENEGPEDRLEDEADTRHDRLNFDTLLQHL